MKIQHNHKTLVKNSWKEVDICHADYGFDITLRPKKDNTMEEYTLSMTPKELSKLLRFLGYRKHSGRS